MEFNDFKFTFVVLEFGFVSFDEVELSFFNYLSFIGFARFEEINFVGFGGTENTFKCLIEIC